MKRFLIGIFALCLTGCIVTNEDFEKTCVLTKKSENIKDTMSIDVTYDNEDVLKKAVVTKTYEALDEDGIKTLEVIKESGTSFNERYAFNEDIKITVSKDEEDVWELKYYIDVPKVKDNILDEFMLKKNSIKFFNKMEKENIECK